jgi:hypothetical protein
MTQFDTSDEVSTSAAMSERQFAQLMTTVATALHQPAAPLSTEQQQVALQFRLLRNGLGRFQSASESFDRALLRIEQIQHDDAIELVSRDPIPREAHSMILVIDSHRIRHERPGLPTDGRWHHMVGGVREVVELVEFLDQFDVPIAAGIPVQIAGPSGEERRPPDAEPGRSAPSTSGGRKSNTQQGR